MSTLRGTVLQSSCLLFFPSPPLLFSSNCLHELKLLTATRDGGIIASQMKTLQRPGRGTHLDARCRDKVPPGKRSPGSHALRNRAQSEAPSKAAPPIQGHAARSCAAPWKDKALKDQVDKNTLKKTLWVTPRKSGRSGHRVFRKLSCMEPMKNIWLNQ